MRTSGLKRLVAVNVYHNHFEIDFFQIKKFILLHSRKGPKKYQFLTNGRERQVPWKHTTEYLDAKLLEEVISLNSLRYCWMKNSENAEISIHHCVAVTTNQNAAVINIK